MFRSTRFGKRLALAAAAGTLAIAQSGHAAILFDLDPLTDVNVNGKTTFDLLSTDGSLKATFTLDGVNGTFKNNDSGNGAVGIASDGDGTDNNVDSTETMFITFADAGTGDPVAVYLQRIFLNAFANGEGVIINGTTYNMDAGESQYQANITFGATEVLADPTLSLTADNTNGVRPINFEVELVPEPASLALLGLGGMLMLTKGRSRRR